MKRMQLLWLEVFREVVRQQSITRAAEALGYTQSAVSRHIASLEHDAGARLLDRLARGVVPTEAGSRLLDHAEAILRHMDEARADLNAVERGIRGRLRVGAFPTAIAALVPRALGTFRAERPEISVSLVEATTPRLLDHLAAGDADVAVVSAAPDRPIEPDGVTLRHLLDERMLVAVPALHPLARRRTVRLAELAADPFVTGSATDETSLLRARLPEGFAPVVDVVVADWTGKLGCVAAGLGVALLPALAARAAPPDVRLLRLHAADAPVRRVFAALPSGRVTGAAARAFVSDLRHAAAQWRNGDRPVA